MSTAFVLMTAMPPTKGHLHLIQFARNVADEVCVIVGTQPGEPYVAERVAAIRSAIAGWPSARLVHIHETLPQVPGSDPDGFWAMWRNFLAGAGCRGDQDFIVASEDYGAELARVTGSRFIPYDFEREITHIRATRVREDPRRRFADMITDFQPTIRQRITVFGAESTGKTTLSRALAARVDGHWLPEWARPYLEHLEDAGITESRMHDIWRGQRALQLQGRELVDRPFIVQDTDLFSTVGYWDFWAPGRTPSALVDDARADQSGLYLVTPSNIPFEPDPQRYGGDRRESEDRYWIDLAERHGLNVAVLTESDPAGRLDEAVDLSIAHFDRSVRLAYERVGN